MAIRFMDGFDKYHSTNNTNVAVQLARNYTSIVTDDSIKTQAGRYGGNAIQLNNAKNNSQIEKAISSSGVSRFIIGFNFKYILVGGTSTTPAVMFLPSNATVYAAGTSRGLTFRVSGDVVYNFGGSGSISYGPLTNNTWYHVEMIWPITASVGNPAILYINGTEVGRSTHADAGIAWNGTLRIISHNLYQSTNSLIDDLYILDDTGSTNNSRLSTSTYIPRIETLFPTSTVANDFTITGGGSAHESQDNNPINTGQYISSTTTGHKARFGVGDLTNISSVKGVQFGAVCSNNTAANDDWKILMDNAEIGTTKTVTNILTNSTSFTQEVFDVNPLTTSLWSGSNINSIEIGIINK